jgi:3-hydroxy acid dehydrogenase/malonic semialdehyde reductase
MSSMEQPLSGKTVLITGASSGIGRSIAFEFARSSPDVRLILAAHRIEQLSQISKDIQGEIGSGVHIHTTQLEVSKPEQIKAFVQNLPSEFQDIDVLVNNAYILPISNPSTVYANYKTQRTCYGYSTGSRYSNNRY